VKSQKEENLDKSNKRGEKKGINPKHTRVISRQVMEKMKGDKGS